MRVEESISIDRPVQEGIDYVSEEGNFPEWTGTAIGHRGKQRAPGPLRESDTFTAVIKFLGHRLETPYERTSYERTSHEPNRRFTELATAGPLPYQRWTYTFEEAPGRTRLTRVVEGEPGGVFKLADPLIERALERQVSPDLATLYDLLEARR
jgi:Polyketide cyclase / dehydrase and lipid transport